MIARSHVNGHEEFRLRVYVPEELRGAFDGPDGAFNDFIKLLKVCNYSYSIAAALQPRECF